jgi:hypothetical protein
MWKIILAVLPLAGCVTTDDNGLRAMLADHYTRADVDAINAEMACKQLARNLVQIARCERAARR